MSSELNEAPIKSITLGSLVRIFWASMDCWIALAISAIVIVFVDPANISFNGHQSYNGRQALSTLEALTIVPFLVVLGFFFSLLGAVLLKPFEGVLPLAQFRWHSS